MIADVVNFAIAGSGFYRAPSFATVIRWRRLRKPNVSCIAGQTAGLHCTYNRILVADLSTCPIYEIGTAPHLSEERVVEHVAGLRRERAVNGNRVACRDHALDRGMKG